MSVNPYAYSAMMHDLALQNRNYKLAEQLRSEKKNYTDFEYNRPENILAREQQAQQQQAQQQQAQQQQAQQQQAAARQQAQQKYGGVFGSGFSGGRGRKYNKSPRRKNKTRKSRKARRLYKSRNRRR